MKKFAIALLLCPLPLWANSYSTTFSNENPAQWIQGQTNGRDWYNVAFLTGFAYGTQPNNQGNLYAADATAVLTGTWGQNQTATATVHLNGLVYGNTDEAEVRINTTISTGRVTGYEVNCGLYPGNTYMTITRWNGVLGDFTTLKSTNSVGCKDGDILSVSRNGSTITAYKNNVAILSVNDTRYVAGSPGIGFYNANNTAVEQKFGFSQFSASDGGTVLSPSVYMSWQMGSGVAMILKAQVSSSSQCPSVTNWTLLTNTTAASYTDTSVAAGASYCYTVVFVSGGLYASASNIVGVDVTSTPGPGVVFSAPQPLLPATNLNGNVLN